MSIGFKAEIRHDAELDAEIIRLEHQAATDVEGIEVAPSFGSNMYRWQYGRRELLVGDKSQLRSDEHEPWTGTPVLWPFPNRVRGKEYVFEGQHHSLRGIHRKAGNDVLIHGLVDTQSWEHTTPTADDTSASVTTSIAIGPESALFEYYPFPSTLSLTYRLMEKSVQIEYVVQNDGDHDMPFGLAVHPYFATLSGMEGTRLRVPANSVMVADEDLLPTGEVVPMGRLGFDLRKPTSVSQLHLDHVMTDLEPGQHPTIEYPSAGLRVAFDMTEAFTHMVVYTEEAGKGFICVEPQTCSTDAINLHARAIQTGDQKLERAAHLITLAGHQAHSGSVTFRIEEYDQS